MRKRLSISLLIALAFVQLLLGTSPSCTVSTQQQHNRYVPGKWFDRVLIIVLENQPLTKTLANAYFKNITSHGALLTKYYGVTHPSQPNYLAMISGDYFGIHSDGDVTLNQTTIVDLLDARGISWRAYQEDYPTDSNCFQGSSHERYRRKHNPFISFNNIRTNSSRCACIVNAQQHFFTDVNNLNLAQYNFYTPNMDNDGHDTGLPGAEKFMRPFLAKLLSNPGYMNRTLTVITFDEDNYLHLNHIYTLLIGPMINPGSQDSYSSYNHYDLLKTIEVNWGLQDLGRRDAKAIPFKLFSEKHNTLHH